MKRIAEITIIIDPDALDAHDGSKSAPPNDPTEWLVSDLFVAIELGIASVATSDPLTFAA